MERSAKKKRAAPKRPKRDYLMVQVSPARKEWYARVASLLDRSVSDIVRAASEAEFSRLADGLRKRGML